MARRAVIRIRTSSETQGESSSPVEQESDCRRFAQENGLTVIQVVCNKNPNPLATDPYNRNRPVFLTEELLDRCKKPLVVISTQSR